MIREEFSVVSIAEEDVVVEDSNGVIADLSLLLLPEEDDKED